MIDKLSEKTALFLAQRNGFDKESTRFTDDWYGAQIFYLNSFLPCLLFGTIVYLGAAYIAVYVSFSVYALLAVWFVILLAIYLFAPTDSAKRNILAAQRFHYKKKSLIVGCFWGLLSLSGFVMAKHFSIQALEPLSIGLMLGLACQTISIFPIHTLWTKDEEKRT